MALTLRGMLRLLAGWVGARRTLAGGELGSMAAAALLLPPAAAGPGGGGIRILAVADTGSGDADQRAIGQRMAEVHRLRTVDPVILVGDNIHPSGNLALVESTFRRPYRELPGTIAATASITV